MDTREKMVSEKAKSNAQKRRKPTRKNRTKRPAESADVRFEPTVVRTEAIWASEGSVLLEAREVKRSFATILMWKFSTS